MTADLSAFFMPGVAGDIFALARGPWARVADHRQAVLLLPPFAEEMNRSRRLMAELAMALALRDVPTLCCDLHGTGDSAGDFSAARWQVWLDDSRRAIAWMRGQGAPAITVLGIRLGGLLALELAAAADRLCLLAPQLDGAQAMRQFLRIRLAADMERRQRGGQAGPSMAMLEQDLQAGGHVTIAGYELDGALYRAIVTRNVKTALPASCPPIDWIGVAANTSPDAESLARQAAPLPGATLHGLSGPPVWGQLEPAPAAELALAVAAIVAPDREPG
ncbi:MAG: hypothetical protein Tsb0016_06300 [Sphingomonadales bacterium]